MKIVFVLPDMPGGGSERVVALLANEYVERGYEVSILLFAGRNVAYPLDKRVEVYIAGDVSRGNPFIMINRVIKMRRYYRKNKNCYIFSFCVRGTIFSVLATIGIPHRMLVSERNDPTKISHQRLRNWSYGKAEKLILQTEAVKMYFPDNLRAKSAVIPNPVPEDLPEPYTGKRKKRVVFVGRLQLQKNPQLLIEAFKTFSLDYEDYELHIFGIGELEEELKKLVMKLNIEDKVVFRGFSSNIRQDIIDSAMYVLSSDYEGISNSMIEALAIGVPVISTDCPVWGSRMYIQNEENGLLVPIGDKIALSKAMKKIAGEPEYAKRISEKGTEIKEVYKLKRIADRFLEEAGI